jgi:hypothetical protein
MFTAMAPLEALSVCPAAATTEVEKDVDGGPLGVLSVFPAVATIKVGDVDGGTPRGHWQHVW